LQNATMIGHGNDFHTGNRHTYIVESNICLVMQLVDNIVINTILLVSFVPLKLVESTWLPWQYCQKQSAYRGIFE